jgi:hypothetical protein
MPCFKPLEAWRQPSGEITFHDKGAGRPLKLSCGQCIGCRLQKSGEWGLRCLHEASLHKENCFITLTYNWENLPRNASLNPEDFRNFMKRLRHKIPGKCRYYQCGEYGERNNRPHHHAIIFGYSPRDLVAIPSPKSGQDIYFSPFLEKVWGKGFVNVGEVTLQSAQYVARYCMKKLTGKAVDKIDEKTGLKPYERIDDITGEIIEVVPEFSTMSRRPGIGANWIRNYKSDVYPKDFVTVNGLRKQPPRFYDKWLKEEDPDLHDYLKACREEAAYTSPDNTEHRLLQREKCANARINNLQRSL